MISVWQQVVVDMFGIVKPCVLLWCVCVQVVLPLVEKYFRAHRAYFITDPNTLQTTETATIREKEMTARSFRIRNLVSLPRPYSPLYLYTRL